MILWKFNAFESESNRNRIQETVNGLSVRWSIGFERTLKWLEVSSKKDWHEPNARKLKNAGPIYEIRFQHDGKQCRPLGYFGPDPGEFTICVWAYHKGKIWAPPGAIESACQIVDKIQAGKGRAVRLKIDGKNFSQG